MLEVFASRHGLPIVIGCGLLGGLVGGGHLLVAFVFSIAFVLLVFGILGFISDVVKGRN